MATTRHKGNQAEEAACQVLIALGYQVWRPSAPRYFKGHSGADIFGVFDLVACQAGKPTRWIQVRQEAAFRRKTIAAIQAVPVGGVREYWLLLSDGTWKTKEL